MMKSWTYKELLNTYLGLFVAVMIVYPKLIALMLVVLFGGVVYGAIKKHLEFKITPIAVLFILLYLMYTIGTVFGNQDQIEFKYLEYKLSFLVLPLMLSFKPKTGSYSFEPLGSGLIIGVLISSLYGITNAALCYADSGEWTCFLTVSISPVHHPSYFMVYLITAMTISWMGYKRHWKGYSLNWIIPFSIYGVIFHAMALSLAGILFLFLTIMVSGLYFVYKKWGALGAIVALVVLPVSGYLVMMNVPQLKGEWEGAKKYADEYYQDPQGFVEKARPNLSGSEARLILWTISALEFLENPMGVGTGNIEKNLEERLRNINQHELADKNLNPHNQFLQTGIEIGIIGLILLFSIIVYGVRAAMRERNVLLLLIIASMVFNSLFESMLQRQSGIVFYTFWICLLIIHPKLYRTEAIEE